NKLNYQPKVVAFLNMNPHNPLGKVMSVKNKDLIEKIGDICLEKGVFVIDDLIYRDLTFDQDNLALPMASYPKYFNNTISLFGLSKS
ncbi:MAG: aminotransferase class I/II-fold pyridoxal phosphate-dependent enzyme, partial [Bacilli bacterium]